jgi:uncharacterized protein (DUF433 family)
MSNLYTPTQAAAVTGLSLKSVQKAIDLNTVPVRRVREKETAKRYLDEIGLLCLWLEAEGLHQLPLRARKDIFKAVVRSPQQSRLGFGDALWVDIKGARKRLTKSLMALRRAERMVTSEEGILTGTPVFKGTRVPVHAIAEMVNVGTSIAEILEGYPTLTEEQVRLAPMYAKAHPLRGRPRNPWRHLRPSKRLRKRLTLLREAG